MSQDSLPMPYASTSAAAGTSSGVPPSAPGGFYGYYPPDPVVRMMGEDDRLETVIIQPSTIPLHPDTPITYETADHLYRLFDGAKNALISQLHKARERIRELSCARGDDATMSYPSVPAQRAHTRARAAPSQTRTPPHTDVQESVGEESSSEDMSDSTPTQELRTKYAHEPSGSRRRHKRGRGSH